MKGERVLRSSRIFHSQKEFRKAFEKAFNKAFEGVGKRIFHAILKTQTDGLPKDSSDLEFWKSDDSTLRLATREEAIIAAKLAILIEDEACNIIYNSVVFDFLSDLAVATTLERRIMANWALMMARKKKNERTSPFERALKANPDKSTKEILRDMEANGKIEDIGDYYLIVNPVIERARWKKIKKISVNSKMSRLRRK